MIRVVIESPLAGDDREANKAYARECMRNSLARGEAPYASHLLFDQPGLLDDTIPEEREQGIQAGFTWGLAGELRAFYVDRGMSSGMLRGLAQARRFGQRVVWRSIGGMSDLRLARIAAQAIQDARGR